MFLLKLVCFKAKNLIFVVALTILFFSSYLLFVIFTGIFQISTFLISVIRKRRGGVLFFNCIIIYNCKKTLELLFFILRVHLVSPLIKLVFEQNYIVVLTLRFHLILILIRIRNYPVDKWLQIKLINIFENLYYMS